MGRVELRRRMIHLVSDSVIEFRRNLCRRRRRRRRRRKFISCNRIHQKLHFERYCQILCGPQETRRSGDCEFTLTAIMGRRRRNRQDHSPLIHFQSDLPIQRSCSLVLSGLHSSGAREEKWRAGHSQRFCSPP